MKRTEFLPWEYDPASAEREEQARVRHELLEAGAALGEGVYVAPSAAVFCDRLALGDRSYVAAGAYLTGELVIGADCSVNPYAVVRGEVRLGDGVRIGAHSSILGFNHFMATDRPIHQQGVFSKGIVVGDDVWIGSSATILDGVRVGSHVVIAAGAIVTKDVEDWAVVAGNPARQLRSRRPDEAPGDALGAEALDDEVLASRLAAFSATVRAQIDDVLARSLDDGAFVDRPSALVGRAAPAIRPWCDAVELSFLVHGRPPLGLDADELATRLQGLQDAESGLVLEGRSLHRGLDGRFDPAETLALLGDSPGYHVLSVGYALSLLGRTFAHPIAAVHELSGSDLVAALEARDWGPGAWASGALVDHIGTALALDWRDIDDRPGDRLADGGAGPLYSLLGWLTARANPETGMWGMRQADSGWLQPVNGFYRLTRGTFAQFGLPLPHPAATVRTVLAHSTDPALETGAGYTACNLLDIIHPLWLAAHQTEEGRAEGEAWARSQLAHALENWIDGQGLAFAPRSEGPDAVPGLQGTEMWLSIVWLLADHLGLSGSLDYRPAGVHAPNPLVTLPPADHGFGS